MIGKLNIKPREERSKVNKHFQCDITMWWNLKTILHFVNFSLFVSKLKFTFLSIFVRQSIVTSERRKKIQKSFINSTFLFFTALWFMIFAGGLLILSTFYNMCINKHTLPCTNPRSPPPIMILFHKKPKKNPLY